MDKKGNRSKKEPWFDFDKVGKKNSGQLQVRYKQLDIGSCFRNIAPRKSDITARDEYNGGSWSLGLGASQVGGRGDTTPEFGSNKRKSDETVESAEKRDRLDSYSETFFEVSPIKLRARSANLADAETEKVSLSLKTTTTLRKEPDPDSKQKRTGKTIEGVQNSVVRSDSDSHNETFFEVNPIKKLSAGVANSPDIYERSPILFCKAKAPVYYRGAKHKKADETVKGVEKSDNLKSQNETFFEVSFIESSVPNSPDTYDISLSPTIFFKAPICYPGSSKQKKADETVDVTEKNNKQSHHQNQTFFEVSSVELSADENEGHDPDETQYSPSIFSKPPIYYPRSKQKKADETVDRAKNKDKLKSHHDTFFEVSTVEDVDDNHDPDETQFSPSSFCKPKSDEAVEDAENDDQLKSPHHKTSFVVGTSALSGDEDPDPDETQLSPIIFWKQKSDEAVEDAVNDDQLKSPHKTFFKVSTIESSGNEGHDSDENSLSPTIFDMNKPSKSRTVVDLDSPPRKSSLEKRGKPLSPSTSHNKRNTLLLLKDFDKIPEMKPPSPNFKYKQPTVRKKNERANLPAWNCEACREYYEALESQMDEKEVARIRNRTCKHRAKYAPVSDTPENFWCTLYPTTQELYDEGHIRVADTPFTPIRRPKKKDNESDSD